MENELTVVDSFTRRLQVEVPWEELQDKYAVFLQKFSKKVRLPGFRKGKVPPKLVRQQFGAAAESEFAESMVQEYYQSALEDTGVESISQATIRAVQFREGQTFRFEATFEVEPEVILPSYQKGMKFEQITYDCDDEDVGRAIEDIRQQQAELRTVEGALEENQYLLADLQEVDESGMPLVGRKMEDRYIHLHPEGPLGPENLEKLRGARVGDTRRVVLTDDAGLPIHYELIVREVTERILPDVDDAFARQVDPEAENLDQLQANLRQKIQEAYEHESHKRLTHDIADHFVRNAQLEVPTSLFENYVDTLVADLEREGYPKEQIDRDAVREEHKASIIWNLKWYLLRKQLIETEEITVADATVDERIQEIIAADETQANQIRNHYRRPENRRSLRQDLISNALFERLKSYAKIKVVHKSSRELRKAS
ncbi:MAG: trigger factor [Fidelibacterota bacterium]|nr:MAG: trigger factor [Candidatus Neomarinimicrobiota bacterium]